MPTIKRHLPIAALVLCLAALHAASAAASVTQEAIIQDDTQLRLNPVGTMQIFRDLGVTRVRVNLNWNAIAPAPGSTHRPKGFHATNPAAYSAAAWAPYDRIIEAAAADGVGVDLTIVGPAPLWATGSGVPRGTTGYFRGAWEPSAREFGYFVRAVGTRYSGTYRPRGAASSLPRVNFWSIWNEPNYGYDLAPQGTGPKQSTPNSPRLYRNLLDAAWSALAATGHGTRTDRILFGEVTPHGTNSWGVFSNMKPLIFLRSLYCVDSRYHQLRGAGGAAQGCPTTAAGSRRFRRENPALFSASGFADHPYEQASAPNRPTHLCGNQLCVGSPSDPNFADLPEIPRLERTLDKLNSVYGSRTRFPIWSTEYGFRTKPPDPRLGVSPTTGAQYMNWAEYLSYRQPRLYSYDQYGLVDPPPPGFFDSGLEYPNGTPKPGFDAFRMPLWLPVTSTGAGQTLEIWGGVRPAGYARLDTGQTQTVEIQFAAGQSASWQTIDTVPITNSKGYIDVHLALPASGSVRLAWSYPASDPLLGAGTVYSRTVSVTIT